ncbi:ataxin-7-like protein 1 isoform X1 [Osmia bicornis bicornis]|uniref:ataxin-7-like protein 1 isoform X1 n=1 Tax=Osmia bicornis bicornis TaxID=1437191 RepID=UPI001EAF8B86|nr:ataxin-7-like protein 1 isoform X1 [Osmia bicornis bicornis]
MSQDETYIDRAETAFCETEGDEETEAQLSTSVTRLSAEDIDLYGFCPERDSFYTVVCETCHAIVKPQALIQHMESRHPSGTVAFPPPTTPVVKPPAKTPYCKVSKLKKAQPSLQISAGSKINHTTVKRNAEQPSISTSLSSSSIPISSSPRSPLESLSVQTSNSSVSVVASSPVKSPGTACQPRRKRLKTDRSLLKDREYDPDRHCGVWNDETGKPCTRSLTCKAHTVSLRRTVIGRSKTFDKLLAEHRASKEVSNRPTKLTVTGTVTLSSTTSSLNPLTPTTPTLIVETEAPSSPPVLSLPDTYPLPKAVDMLYRCLAPHGSAKPTKLEEDFANEELRSLESSLVNSTGSSQSSSMMAPISVVLPSLSPLPANSEEASSVATLIPSTASPAIPVPATLPATCTQPSLVTTVLEGETPIDIDPESAMTIYSPVYKDKSQLVVQLPRLNNIAHSPISRSCQQVPASMPSLIFEPMEQLEQLEQLEQQHATQINGKRLNHTSHSSLVNQRQSKRSKHDYQQELSTAIQVEATTTSSPYPHFGDISWSNCHPEPLAVSRWLRISSSRKQYNFNIH